MNYKEFNIIVERKKIRNLYVRAVNDYTLLATCPNRMKDDEVYKFIAENEDKIRNNIQKAKQRQERSSIYRGGDTFVVFGQKKTIDPNININKLYQDLNKQLLVIANEYLNKYIPMLLDYGYHQTPILKIKKMTSKWGVCYTTKNTICLSTYLVHYKKEYIECIVLHELCHFIVPNHSKRFYSLIENRIPDYKEKIKQLV